MANTLAGYKLESLRAEERRLLDERRTLELEEAELLSPERLEKLAQQAESGDSASRARWSIWKARPDGAVAMVK